MITDIYTPIDENCRQSLEAIQNVIDSKSFLAGLGKNHQNHPIPTGFNVITNFERCLYLRTSQQMWEIPDDERQDQYFADVLDDAVDYTGFVTFERSEVRHRKSFFRAREKRKQLNDFLYETIKSRYEQHDIADFLLSGFPDANKPSIDDFSSFILPQCTDNCFRLFIRSAYFGGFQRWPVCEYLLQCYQVGGFPTGWVGPLPKHGGESSKCMQLMHFGPKEC